MRNLKLAFRTLFRTPFVAGVAILSLALGIGANAAIFSLLDQLLRRPLPVPQPEQLVNLAAPGPKWGSASCNQAGDCDLVFSFPMFRDLEREQAVFSGLAAHRSFGANLAFGSQTVDGEGMFVSGSYFPTLRLQPALGRLLAPADDQTVGGHYVAVLGHSYWETQLGADPAVLGQAIVVNGQTMTVVGVTPRGFEGTTLGTQPRVYVPITMSGQLVPGFTDFEDRRNYGIYLFARLKPGVSMEQAEQAMNALYRPILNDVEAPLQEGMNEAILAQFRARSITFSEGRRGQSSLHGQTRIPLILLFSVTGLVLLIACANIANLLLARGAGRSTEMAVRLSLGASRRHVMAQLLTESLLLALLGGLASLLVARGTLLLIRSFLPPGPAAALSFQLDTSVIVFAAALAIGTGLVFGMFPALHSTRPDLVTTLRAGSGKTSATRSATRFRAILVTSQIALSMALLILSGLFLRSLVNISRVDLGVNVENVVTFAISPERNGYEAAQSKTLFERAEQELAALPGVAGVTAARVPLLGGNNWGTDVSVEGFEGGPDVDANARFNVIGPGYFGTLGVPLLAGREFTAADDIGTPKVAVVNEAFAKKFNLGGDVVGRSLAIGTADELDIQIVGLVRDAKYSQVKDEVPPLFFTPYRQIENVGTITFYVRTALPPEQTIRSVRSVVAGLDPNLPIENLKTLSQQVRENVALDRMISTLSAGFAAVATLLAAVGLYGVLAYTVALRRREIGVRMALGADSPRVRRLVLRQVIGMLLVGGPIGIAAALGLGRVAGSLLYGITSSDPAVVALAGGLLGLIALGTGYIPALRASRVDPMQALRYE